MALNHLPAPLTNLVGRKQEIAAACELLREPGVRLLTLTGPPGIGKTRLSIAVANALTAAPSLFPDGAHFVSLASIVNPDLVAPAIARALAVRESGADSRASLREFLRPKRLLLVLDNFEQVVAAALLVTDLLAAAPGVKALVTSRQVLHVYGEHEFPLSPLDLPDANRLPTALPRSFFARYPSIQLFRDRARAAKPDFQVTPDNAADVARICAWLDGLPLAIEMAAAQVKWLPTDKLLRQLSDRLAALTGGPRDLSPRQQSLTGAIDWSYNLLDPVEQTLFRVLGVFCGGCEEEAILDCRFLIPDAPGQDSPISVSRLQAAVKALVDKSLLRHQTAPADQSRYSMFETLRDYAREKLTASGQLDRAQQAHAEHYFRLAQSARPHLATGGEQAEWVQRLEMEHDNLRAALDWASAPNAAASAARVEFALRLAEAMHHFWYLRGYFGEDQCWLDQVLALGGPPTELRAQVLNHAGQTARLQGDYERAWSCHTQAHAMQDSLGDEPGQCRSLESLAILAGTQGNYAQAGQMLEQALALRRKLGDAHKTVSTLNNLAIVARRTGDPARSAQLYRECAELSRASHDAHSHSHALHGLGELAFESGDYGRALDYMRECVAIRAQLGNRPALVNTLGALAMTYGRLGRGDMAARLLGANEKLRQEIGLAVPPASEAETHKHLAEVRAMLGEAEFERGLAAGQAMTLDEVVAMSLGSA